MEARDRDADRIFLLSPARTDGKRAALLFNDAARFELAQRIRSEGGAPIGEVFSFLSGLYFRGKLAYARCFGRAAAPLHGGYVITPNAGLAPVEWNISIATLRGFAETPIDLANERYLQPLRESVAQLREQLTPGSVVVLLGSIATGKYVDPLVTVLGDRLKFPTEFIGRGDMSRGGLLLRSVANPTELEYESIARVAVRTGRRPPKLTPIKPRRGEEPGR
jgi:hypothetical protein